SRRRNAHGHIIFPIERVGIDYHAFHCGCSVVASTTGSVAAVALGNDYAAAVGVEENFGRIEPPATRGVEWSLDSIAVDLPWLYVRHEHVPVVVCAVGERIEANHAHRLDAIVLIKEQQLHAARMTGENAEVDAAIGCCSSERGALTGRHYVVHAA